MWNELISMLDQSSILSLLLLFGLLYNIAKWVVISSPEFVNTWGQRVALFVLILWIGRHLVHFGWTTPGELVVVIFRALLIAGLALSVIWILLPVLVFILQNLQNKFRSRRAKLPSSKAIPPSAPQPVLTVPKIDHAQKEAEVQARKQEQQKRLDARAKVTRFYSQHEHLIRDRLSREFLESYFNTYMSHDFSVTDVQRRGRELIKLIEHHVDACGEGSTPQSLGSLADWYQQQSDEIEQLQIEERLKKTLLTQLKVKYIELTELFLENLQP